MQKTDKLSQAVAAELLHKLAHDPAFYERFKNNPSDSLRELEGYQPSAIDACFDSLTQMQLRDPADYADASGEMLKMLTRSMGQMVHQLSTTPKRE